ncbi:MAG: CinA family nicotinamide mononucleotide deamidase-related protein [Brevinematia bacterium]
MRCAIVTIGSEITKGFVLDSNSNFLAKELNILGVDVRYIVSVGDDKKEILNVFDFISKDVDFVITTGGLGPTLDDLTRECVSEFLGVEFELSNKIWENIQEKFSKYNNGQVPSINIRQAYVPKGGIIIENEIGSAPGYIIHKDGKILVSLPGVPQEMRSMFYHFLKDYISDNILKSDKKEFFVKILGMPESRVDQLISEISDVPYNTIADYGVVDVIFYLDKNNYENLKTRVIEFISNKMRDKDVLFYFSDVREDIPFIVKNEFKKKGITLSVAESMTGGYLSQILTSVPGATEYFLGGVVSYSDVSKVKLLKVREETLKKHFSTSLETTFEMALNSLNIFNSDVSVGITGIAGPTTDSSNKEIGTVYIAVMNKNGKSLSKEFKLFGNREKIRSYASLKAIEMLIKLVRMEYDNEK